jgi:hypothetical protein
MEGAVLAIHLIPSFIVFAFADCRPFRFAEAIAHTVPRTVQWPVSSPPSSLNLKRKAVRSAHSPKCSKRRGQSALSLSEPILRTLKIRNELAVLNSYHGLEIQAPHDCHEV